MTFVDIVGDINQVLYGIAAGVAILLVVIHGVKWKTADSLEGREEAKRGVLNVILGLAIIVIAAALVSLIL
jgi:type IV secretory pathway VirB2 component (pilin)